MHRNCSMSKSQHARWQGVDHPLIQAPAQKPDETAAVVAFDFRRQTNIRPEPAVVALEFGMTRRAEIPNVDPEQADALRGLRRLRMLPAALISA